MTVAARTQQIVDFLRANDCPYSAAIVETKFVWQTPGGRNQRRADVLRLHGEGKSPLEIAQELRISPATASRIIQRTQQGWAR